MSACPECGQLLGPEAARCKNCGHDVHARPMPPERRDDRDATSDAEELLAAVIATGAGASRRSPDNPEPAPSSTADDEGPAGEIGDVVPEPDRRPFWRWRR